VTLDFKTATGFYWQTDRLPDGSKISGRATPPLWASWVTDFIEECAAFPNGAHDDQVDAMTQALLRWNLVPEEQVISLYVPYEISPI
jgi:hypothetical protein